MFIRLAKAHCYQLQILLRYHTTFERKYWVLSSVFVRKLCRKRRLPTLHDQKFKTLSFTQKRIGKDDIDTTLRGNNEVILGANGKHEISSIDEEFMEIQVFPENFDKLPSKCSGCGVVLQSSAVDKPGFIPENRNPSFPKNYEENQFQAEIICSRCFNIKHYNKEAMTVVSSNHIEVYMKHIARQKALILYNIDVTDFPSSFIPNILNFVGETKYLILICNKVDRLSVDGNPRRQLEHIRQSVLQQCEQYGLSNGKIVDVCLISAKTGFGVHHLIRTITTNWRRNSDIYIVGSQNTGKTTLFNLLVDLFAASRHTENMLQRGTTSDTPGTTLNILRYPITYHRFLRLENRLRKGYSKERDGRKLREVHIDKDIIDQDLTKYSNIPEAGTVNNSNEVCDVVPLKAELVGKKVDNENVQWIYDTPGLPNENQMSHFLTNNELQMMNPSLWFVPRTVILKPGKVIFLGGLARIDYLNIQRISRTTNDKKESVPNASQSVFFTIFTSPNLPIHVTSLEKADDFYQEHAGSDLLKVPSGTKDRMELFPKLSGHEMEVHGVGWKQSAADVTLSSVGWVAVTAGIGSIVTIKAHTPNSVGLFLRHPPLLPKSVMQRGRRGVPYLGHINYAMYQGTRKRSPSLVNILTKGKNLGVTEWMAVAEEKRKQQRAVLKFEKMKWHSLKRIGFSARSNPTKYLQDYEHYEELDEHDTKLVEGEIIKEKSSDNN